MPTWLDQRNNIVCPERIGVCPIVEAIVDLRFDSNLPEDAVFGVAYQAVASIFKNSAVRLPVADIPGEIRNRDPQLRFQPHYRLSAGNFLLQVGPKVISFLTRRDYMGWEAFLGSIQPCLKEIVKKDFISNFTRIGVRYINLIEDDIWNNIRIDLSADGSPFITKHKNLHFLLETGNFITGVKIVDHATLRQDKGETLSGSLLDIDTYKTTSWNGINETLKLINEAHLEEKMTFFSVLNEDYIKKLEPTYE